MPIDIKRLEDIYNTADLSSENRSWIAIPDSKENKLIANAVGSSGGEPENGWKIHISLDPKHMAQAAKLISEELNRDDAPRVSIKFSGKHLAKSGQPSKQVAFIFYQEELKDKKKIADFLNRIESLLRSHHIGMDQRPINSDEDSNQTKYDAPILDDNHKPTRYNYRNESCVVLDDGLYMETAGAGNTSVHGISILVKQSYYLTLPLSERHNPGGPEDPLASVQIHLPVVPDRTDSPHSFFQNGTIPPSLNTNPTPPTVSCFSTQHYQEILQAIIQLQKEIDSWWPYPNKDRKKVKIEGLQELLTLSLTKNAADAVQEIEARFPDIRKGTISARTAELLDRVRGNSSPPPSL
ncbi:MAG: hypothetical protein NTW94_01675 [Legionellales bacterium]|nr:hypothetical protein [Legionellales bacterium]